MPSFRFQTRFHACDTYNSSIEGLISDGVYFLIYMIVAEIHRGVCMLQKNPDMKYHIKSNKNNEM